jgi:MFS family permease
MKQALRLLAIFNFLTDFSLFAPIAVIYYTRVSGSLTLGMSIFSLAMLSSAIFELPTGVLSDRVGRKMTFILGSIFAIASAIGYAIGLSYWWLVAGAIGEGIARAFFSGNNDAYLHDLLTEHGKGEDYAHWLGHTSAMFQIALAISGLMGAVIAQWSFAVVLWLSVLPAIAKLIVASRLPAVRVHTPLSTNIYAHTWAALKLFWTNRHLRWLSLAGMLDYAIGESKYQFRGAFVQTLWPIWAIGISSVLSNIGGAIGFAASGKVIRKFGEIPTLLGGLLYSQVTNFIALIFPGIGSPLLMSTNSVFFGTSTVSQESLLQKQFTAHQRATMGSLNSLGGSLLFAVTAVSLGGLADRLSPAGGLLIFQLLTLIPLGMYYQLFRQRRA